MKKIFLISLLTIHVSVFASTNPTIEVDQMLNRFHEAASKSDGATYFNLFAPEAVFLGTDATERWTVIEFKKYAEPFFSKKKGWTYAASKRHITFAPNNEVGWFDEILENKNYGTCRGSGVVRKIGNDWKVAQYHLTIPVPNALAVSVVKQIREQGAEKKN